MKRQGEGSLTQGDFTSVKTDENGITGHVSSTLTGVLRNPKNIKGTVTISADENVVMAGPIQIDGSLVVEGTLVIV
ncbi:hypothetical protein [uncultured Mediterranean phage uvMED]|nr:hypothetical protein [uncultured Mediterranean phage uvMED]